MVPSSRPTGAFWIRGIGHGIKPATSDSSTEEQRSHRIDAEQFYRRLAGVVTDDTWVLMTARLTV
jgi:hypothetical protein